MRLIVVLTVTMMFAAPASATEETPSERIQSIIKDLSDMPQDDHLEDHMDDHTGDHVVGEEMC